MSGRRKNHPTEHHEEHADETWLVPYSDILTLLLALFIVLFASAQVDQKKFDQIRQAFNVSFGNGSMSVLPNMNSVASAVTQTNSGEEKVKISAGVVEESEDQIFQKEMRQLTEVKKVVDGYIQENNMQDFLETAFVTEGLMIRIKEAALFSSGSSDLRPESKALAGVLAGMMAKIPQNVVISGHTDNVPILTERFPSNWHLSGMRAINFMTFLLAQDSRLTPQRFSAIGYGEYRPVASNDTPAGREKNRRVEICIMRSH